MKPHRGTKGLSPWRGNWEGPSPRQVRGWGAGKGVRTHTGSKGGAILAPGYIIWDQGKDMQTASCEGNTIEAWQTQSHMSIWKEQGKGKNNRRQDEIRSLEIKYDLGGSAALYGECSSLRMVRRQPLRLLIWFGHE